MLYIIGPHHMGPLKVGIAQDPERRLRQLQTGHPEKLHLYATAEAGFFCVLMRPRRIGLPDAEAERFIHNRFAERRLQGEWFDVSLDCLVYGMDGAEMQHREFIGDFEVTWDLTEKGQEADDLTAEELGMS